MKRKIYIRADGNSQIGLGHVIRCTALADMLRDDFFCTFLIQKPSEFLKNEMKNAGADYIEISETKNYISEVKEISEKFIKSENIVVLDGYNFETEYQRIVKNTGCKLVCIDDIHTYHFVADAVINHAGGVKAEQYSMAEYTKLFLGFNYALLRKPFRESLIKERILDKIEACFVFLGGGFIPLITKYSLSVLLEIVSIKQINFVKGNEVIFKNEVIPLIKRSSKINVFENLSAEEFCKLIEVSQLAICPASTTALECCSVGVGLISIKTVENQENILLGIDGMKLGQTNAEILMQTNEFLKNSLKYYLDDDNNLKNVLVHQKKIFNYNIINSLVQIFKDLC